MLGRFWTIWFGAGGLISVWIISLDMPDSIKYALIFVQVVVVAIVIAFKPPKNPSKF